MVEGACLENRCTATYRGFESLTHRINASIFAGVSRFPRTALPSPFCRPAASESLRAGCLPVVASLLPSPFSLHAPDGASLRASRFPAVRGAEGLLRPRQQLFSAARGAEALLRPRQPLFPAARGAEGIICPWRWLFLFAGGVWLRWETMEPRRRSLSGIVVSHGPNFGPWETRGCRRGRQDHVFVSHCCGCSSGGGRDGIGRECV